jgi:hypothetical protein
VVRDLDGSGNTVADYLNGPGIDNKLRQTASGVVSYFATDHLGTTVALTGASGSLSSTLNYDSFGNVTGGSPSTRYTFPGPPNPGFALSFRLIVVDVCQGGKRIYTSKTITVNF